MMLMKKTMIVGQTASLSSSKTLRKRVTVKTKRARASRKKVLEKVMKLELLEDKTPEEIAVIWTEFWRQKVIIYLLWLFSFSFITGRCLCCHSLRYLQSYGGEVS